MTNESEIYSDKRETAIDPNDAVDVIGVSFRDSGKIYHFASCGKKLREGTKAIVETARGIEYGTVTMSNRLIPKSELVLPLKKLIRQATPEDDAKFEENRRKEDEAFAVCKQKINEHGLDMKLIDVEYTFDNAKLLFYFTSEDRVDFRDLVKDLAGIFHTRIELRQIGIRDETKIMGGLGVCYREYCCHSFLGDFAQVSIKMAKEQGLSLSSAKISGACGRLMCCLRFEHETYQEEIARTPKVGAALVTSDGTGVVIESKPLLGLVKVRLDADPEGAPKIYDRDAVRPKTDEDETTKRGEKVERVARPVNVPFVRERYNVLTAETEKNGEKSDKTVRNEKTEKNETAKKRQNKKNQPKRPEKAQTETPEKESEKPIKGKKSEPETVQNDKNDKNDKNDNRQRGKDRRPKQGGDRERGGQQTPVAEKVSEKAIEKTDARVDKTDGAGESTVRNDKKKRNGKNYYKRPQKGTSNRAGRPESDKK